jgi:photosystem II stability/assembly factor-like uncharacterized protein
VISRALAPLLAALLAVPVSAQDPSISQPPPPPTVTSLTLFAGTSEGLWRSQDWGGSWELVRGKSSGVPLEKLGAARAILPLGPQVFVAGTGGFFISSDFGETWQPRGPTIDASALLISRYPQSDPTVFLGTATGLQKSADAGQTYRPTGLGETPVYRLEWPGPALVAATGDGVRISGDGGATFSGSSLPTEKKGVRAVALSSFFAIDPVLFAAAESGGVFRSGDGARTWEPAGLSGEKVFDLVWLGPFLYAAGELGFYRSEDAGKNWTRVSDSPGRPSRLLFPLAPAAGLEAFLSTDRGVFRTVDAGVHWHPAGLAGKDVFLVATFPPPEPLTTKGKKPRR